MPELVCPVCGAALVQVGRTRKCAAGHSYDIAKQNYVNLLMRNQSSKKRHGDDRLMVDARRAFLDGGWYAPLREALCALAVKYAGQDAEVLDAGCGEGYYTAAVRSALEGAGKRCSAVGIDISRVALAAAARRDAQLSLAVASVSALPVADGSCDMVLNVFAPEDAGEFYRVLRPGGVVLKAAPLEDHLLGLKAAVYDRPYRNPPPTAALAGFALAERVDITGSILVQPGAQVQNLFRMTPYYYKTGAADQARLAALERLETEIGFGVFVLKKSP